MRKLRVAVIGLGGVSHGHLREYGLKREVSVVGLSDASPVALGKAAEKYAGAYVNVDWREMLAKSRPDVVSICTPNKFHAEQVLASLDLGAHVACEKPMAMNLPEALQMEMARAKAHKIGLINFSYRNCTSFRFARELIARGELGPIQRVNCMYLQSFLGASNNLHSWRNDITLAGFGAMGDLGVHMIDSVLFITGLEIDRVVGLVQSMIPSKKNSAGEECAITTDTNGSFLGQFTNGSIGTFETTQTAPGYGNYFRIEISGTLGTLAVLSEDADKIWLHQGRVMTTYGTWQTSLPALVIPTDFASTNPPPTPGSIIDAIRGETSDYPSFANGVIAQQILDGVMTSSQTGQWVRIDK